MMLHILLRNRIGVTVATAQVDDADAEIVGNWRWGLTKGGYVRRNARVDGKQVTIYLHREILGAGPGVEVDHKDGNPLNNTRENLRLATHAQNQENKARHQYRGTCWAEREGKWKASVQLHGRHHHLGYFDDRQEAADVAAQFRASHMTHATN